eukprot:1394627-Amorphochlora_amoeboformis.AAC.2
MYAESTTGRDREKVRERDRGRGTEHTDIERGERHERGDREKQSEGNATVFPSRSSAFEGAQLRLMLGQGLHRVWVP